MFSSKFANREGPKPNPRPDSLFIMLHILYMPACLCAIMHAHFHSGWYLICDTIMIPIVLYTFEIPKPQWQILHRWLMIVMNRMQQTTIRYSQSMAPTKVHRWNNVQKAHISPLSALSPVQWRWESSRLQQHEQSKKSWSHEDLQRLQLLLQNLGTNNRNKTYGLLWYSPKKN